ncbi:MAG TPA: hypothetical protein VEY91_07770, partial [Candidatus Limnocylindria bacterium]|nr:hypothetical protein [Candidatus Limnocylindria bacterium]
MEGDREEGLRGRASPDFRARLIGAAVSGALFASLLGLVVGLLWRRLPGALAIHPSLPPGFSGGGWLALPLAGAALALFLARRWANTAHERRVAAMLALFGVLGAGGVLFGAGPSPEGSAAAPKTQRGKARAILKWSYRSPATVARILPYAGDPDPTV